MTPDAEAEREAAKGSTSLKKAHRHPSGSHATDAASIPEHTLP
jgi:hypothetical protein